MNTIAIDELSEKVEKLRLDAEALQASAEYLEKLGWHEKGADELKTHARALRFAADSIAELYEMPF